MVFLLNIQSWKYSCWCRFKQMLSVSLWRRWRFSPWIYFLAYFLCSQACWIARWKGNCLLIYWFWKLVVGFEHRACYSSHFYSLLTVQTCQGVTGYAVKACSSFWSNDTCNCFSTSLCWCWSTSRGKVTSISTYYSFPFLMYFICEWS